MDHLSVDSAAHVVSWLLDYTYVTPELGFHHRSLVKACKLLKQAVDINLATYTREATQGRWQSAPQNLLNVVFTDALRLRIECVTRRVALALGCSKEDLEDLDFDEVRLTSYYAHVFDVSDVWSILSSRHPNYITPGNISSNARPRKRGLYIQEYNREQARKKRLLDLEPRQELALSNRRAKIEAHPEWPFIQSIHQRTGRNDIFGDFLDRKLRCTTKLAEIVENAQHLADVLAGKTTTNTGESVCKRLCSKSPCHSTGCNNVVARDCPFHLCGKHCKGCTRHNKGRY